MNYQSESGPDSSLLSETPAESVKPVASLPGPGQARNWALTLLTLFAIIWMLHWAQAVCIPVMLALLISYTLSPLVSRLQQWRITRAGRSVRRCNRQHAESRQAARRCGN